MGQQKFEKTENKNTIRMEKTTPVNKQYLLEEYITNHVEAVVILRRTVPG